MKYWFLLLLRKMHDLAISTEKQELKIEHKLLFSHHSFISFPFYPVSCWTILTNS